MTRTRLPHADRRSLILAAAQSVFAQRGFDGAKTQQVAAAANVSEALVYRHFPSKLALYRAVLRHLIRQQDANYRLIGMPAQTTESLLHSLHAYFEVCLLTREGANAEGVRFLFASLVGDSSYARLVYRRAMRLLGNRMTQALDAARAAGDVGGEGVASTNASLFVEHIGSMITASRLTTPPALPHVGDDDAVILDALRFCARGLGIKDAAIERYLQEARSGLQSSTAIDGLQKPPPRAQVKARARAKKGAA